MNSRASKPPDRCETATACSPRSCRSARVGSPVSASMRGYKVEMFLVFPKRGLCSFLIANVMERDHHGGHLRTIGMPDRTRVDRYPSTLPAGDDPHHRVGAGMAAQGSDDRALSHWVSSAVLLDR